MGTAVNPGFCYFRSGAKGEAVVRLITESVVRGLIEFYLRWNNIASPILTLTHSCRTCILQRTASPVGLRSSSSS